MKKILIVDDEPHNVEWVADFVRYLKGVPTIVSGEQEACDYLRDNPDCGLLIVDIRIGSSGISTHSVTMKDANKDWAGLYVANYARVDLGKTAKQLTIVSYTVVKDEDLEVRLKSLQARYFQKGDLAGLKDFIRSHLE